MPCESSGYEALKYSQEKETHAIMQVRVPGDPPEIWTSLLRSRSCPLSVPVGCGLLQNSAVLKGPLSCTLFLALLSGTLGGQGGWITRSGVRDQPDQHGETPSLLKLQKLAGVVVIPTQFSVLRLCGT
ncbi:Zinc finger protein 714 [Plecturocebus cupreus]